jgi:hypothetical protein
MYPGLPTRLEKDIRERYLNEVLKGTQLPVLQWWPCCEILWMQPAAWFSEPPLRATSILCSYCAEALIATKSQLN